ncbi:MAG: class I SAM-dependent methyltransferase, partial [Solirubrobacterales bacterium]|nr:class I SAM-dependent methyltransferase [Solirubrobacterales bacterium]
MPRLQVPSKLLAAVYDKVNAGPEDAGVAALRGGLLSHARGRVIEIGAGTGLNLAHYPPTVAHLVLSEPDVNMRAKLRVKLDAGAGPQAVEVSDATAGDLPYDDASFDTVVATMVLCTVPEPSLALAELRRVMRPDGRLLVLEHVRSERSGVARLQDAVVPLYGFMGRGCHPNRDTLAAIRAAGFTLDEHRR